MLILSRRPGERIFIYAKNGARLEVCITLLDIKGGQTRIGIDADNSYTILREEVFLRIAEENQINNDDSEEE